jgi:hypothetical protein
VACGCIRAVGFLPKKFLEVPSLRGSKSHYCYGSLVYYSALGAGLKGLQARSRAKSYRTTHSLMIVGRKVTFLGHLVREVCQLQPGLRQEGSIWQAIILRTIIIKCG